MPHASTINVMNEQNGNIFARRRKAGNVACNVQVWPEPFKSQAQEQADFFAIKVMDEQNGKIFARHRKAGNVARNVQVWPEPLKSQAQEQADFFAIEVMNEHLLPDTGANC